jgi:Flp pilus assembly pilin Flp
MKIIRAFLADETGATTIIPVVNGLGVKLNAKFTPINTSLK